MIINQKEAALKLPSENDSVDPLLKNLNMNTSKYRQFKEELLRVNSLDNEIHLLSTKPQTSNSINFLTAIKISDDAYNDAVRAANQILDNLLEDHVSDLISHRNLFSSQKHLMEIFSMFLGYKYFDWCILREKLNFYDLKIQMSELDYNEIDKKHFNLVLNKLCKCNFIDKGIVFISSEFCTDSGMEMIYEWIKAEIKIFIYITQNAKRIIIKPKDPKNTTSKKNKMKINTGFNETNEGFKSTGNEVTDTKYNTNAINSMYQTNKFNKTNNSTTFFSMNKSNNNFFNSQKKRKKSSTRGTKDTVNIENFTNAMDSISRGSTTKRQNPNNTNLLIVSSSTKKCKPGDYKHSKTLRFKDQSNQSYPDDFLLTSLPFLKNKTIKDRLTARRVSTDDYVKHQYLSLNGFNYDDKFKEREEKVMEYLPMLKYKTFRQMRAFYGSEIPYDCKFERLHLKEFPSYTDMNPKNKQKLFTLLSKGSNVLDKIPEFKLKEFLKDEEKYKPPRDFNFRFKK